MARVVVLLPGEIHELFPVKPRHPELAACGETIRETASANPAIAFFAVRLRDRGRMVELLQPLGHR